MIQLPRSISTATRAIRGSPGSQKSRLHEFHRKRAPKRTMKNRTVPDRGPAGGEGVVFGVSVFRGQGSESELNSEPRV
jgi:hypothetical protein